MNQSAERTLVNRYEKISSEVKTSRGWFMILGIILVLLGIAAIGFPFIATLTIELFIGWILVISGVMGVFHAFRTSAWKGFLFSLLSALLSLGIGIMLLLYPFTGIISLTLLIAVFFIASGIFRIAFAFRLRPFDHWGWLLLNGILALIIAAFILTQLPEVAGWVIGVLVGIDLIIAGWVSIMLATAARGSS